MVLIVVLGGTPRFAAQGDPAVTEFLINSLAPSGTDNKAGDAKCETADPIPVCTLQAAIEQGLYTAEHHGPVRIGVAEGTSGTIEITESDLKSKKTALAFTTKAGPTDLLTYFPLEKPIKHKLTIDLGKKLSVQYKPTPNGTVTPAAAFYVNSPDVELIGFDDIYFSDTSIAFGPNSDGSSLRDGESLHPTTTDAKHMVRIMPGADSITIEDYKMGGFSGLANYMWNRNERFFGMISVTGDPAAGPVSNLTLNRLVLDNGEMVYNATENRYDPQCEANPVWACAQAGVIFDDHIRIDGLAITNSKFMNFPNYRDPLDLDDAGPSSDWIIQGNTFTDIASGIDYYEATLQLPFTQPLSGQNYIRDNTFINDPNLRQGFGIRWWGPNGDGADMASNLYIEDNYFDGHIAQSILLTNVGTATVRFNRFGVNSASASSGETEETQTSNVGWDEPTLFLNSTNTTNRNILTWYPTDMTVVECDPRVTIEKYLTPMNSEHNLPREPVTLDFYFTKQNAAELYLGSIENISEAGEMRLPTLPVEEGYIRLQTQAFSPTGQLESSQFSRTVKYDGPGDCWTPSAKITVRAWTDVQEPDATYDEIIGGDGVELLSGAKPLPGTPVWYTYTVKNTSAHPLSDVEVRDSENAPLVCIIGDLPPIARTGCVRRAVIEIRHPIE
jgi:hypothetical protein